MALVRPVRVVELEVHRQSLPRGADAVVGLEVHVLVLHAAPQSLDEHVVSPTAFAVRALGRADAPDLGGEFRAAELTALVGVDDLRYTPARCGLSQGLDTEVSLHVIDTRCASTRRQCQPSTATRYTQPRAIGMYVMSNAQTWLARSMASPRSAYGNTGCAGCFLLVLGLRYSA